MRLLVMPGFSLQHLTTKEPDDSMILVAMKAVNETTDKFEQKVRENL